MVEIHLQTYLVYCGEQLVVDVRQLTGPLTSVVLQFPDMDHLFSI